MYFYFPKLMKYQFPKDFNFTKETYNNKALGQKSFKLKVLSIEC